MPSSSHAHADFQPLRDDGAAALLTAFSRELLALHALRTAPGSIAWVNDALAGLRRLVPFDKAWWGECSDCRGDEPPLNWQHGTIGLPESFAAEWNAISAVDEFAQTSIERLGEVCCSSGYDSGGPGTEAFSRQHDIQHAMAITLELPGSGLLFFVVLYRGESEPAFGPGDEPVFGEYGRHLMQHWQVGLQTLLGQASTDGARAYALCQRDGRLLYIGATLARALRRQFNGWQGQSLPEALRTALQRAPCRVPLGRQSLVVARCGELYTLGLGQAGDSPALAPRERAVAMLYARGESYKAIAARLGLSPATVRTYLRDAYLQLGVRNKVALGARLQASDMHS
jgi:DNA-binding CsgD family transcriptional regulator